MPTKQILWYFWRHVTAFQDSDTDSVSQYRYLGILINDAFSFVPHGKQLTQIKPFFFLTIKFCLSFEPKKKLVSTTFMSMLDYDDVIYMHASSQCLHTWTQSTMELWGSSQILELLFTIVLCMLASDGLLCSPIGLGLPYTVQLWANERSTLWKRKIVCPTQIIGQLFD